MATPTSTNNGTRGRRAQTPVHILDNLRQSSNKKQFEYHLKRIIDRICRGDTLPHQEMADLLALLENKKPKYTRHLLLVLTDEYPTGPKINSNCRMIIEHITEKGIHAIKGWYVGYFYECTKTIRAFTAEFPDEMRRFLDKLIQEKIRLPGEFIEPFRQVLTDTNYTQLTPNDASALRTLVQTLGSDISAEHLQVMIRATGNHYQQWSANHYALMMDSLPDNLRPVVLQTIVEISLQPEDALHAILAQSSKTPQEELLNALRHLYCGPRAQKRILDDHFSFDDPTQENYQIVLRSPLKLPPDLTGDDLCYLLISLADNIQDESTATITGIPNSEELPARALETLMQDPDIFNLAQKARDKLETRSIMPNSIPALTEMVAHMGAHMTTAFLAEKLDIVAQRQSMDIRWPPETYAAHYGKLLDSIPRTMYMDLLALLRRRFHRKRLSLATVIIASSTSPPHLVAHAMSHLTMKFHDNPFHHDQLQLSATYHISADIEGDDLCDTINHLGSCITLTPTGRIEGLPTQEEFRLRTIKTKETFKRKTAMNWRDKIAEDTKQKNEETIKRG